MRKIKFNPATFSASKTGHDPAPSVKFLPTWYKKMPKSYNDQKRSEIDGSPFLTIKACPPFLDSMMSGYMICTEYDLHVTKSDLGPEIRWKAGGDLISSHAREQIVPEQIPVGFDSQPFKFINLWQIITPKGYSTLFMHPLNRVDLPFFTISGIVETDQYKNVINFPFLLRQDFEGEIPAGTPIVQLFPFKREHWRMDKGVLNEEELKSESLKLNFKFSGSYKSQWWTRKKYE